MALALAELGDRPPLGGVGVDARRVVRAAFFVFFVCFLMIDCLVLARE